MPEMSTLNGKSKVPMLPSQGVSYAKWGRWVDAFSSCLTLKGLHLFAAQDTREHQHNASDKPPHSTLIGPWPAAADAACSYNAM